MSVETSPKFPGVPLADPLDRISDAMLMYVQNTSMLGVIPRISMNIVRAPSDLPGTSSDNEWQITLTIAAIEGFDDQGLPNYAFTRKFEVAAASKPEAIDALLAETKSYLQGECVQRETQLLAAREALSAVECMPVLTDMWPT
jgi:hypothetical protein